MQAAKQDIIKKLQKEVLSMQRLKRAPGQSHTINMWELEQAFPDQSFPLGAIHEFVSNTAEEAAATTGFMAGLISRLAPKSRTILWVSSKRTLFVPALTAFGIDPGSIIFIDLWRQKDVLWAIEETLKCDALQVVVGELSELGFTESRRLQLAVEQSKVTGFIHRYNPKKANITASVTQWKIKPIAGEISQMPGVGFARWQVQLLKVRNGKPGAWTIEWRGGCFKHIPRQALPACDIETPSTPSIAEYA